MFVVALSHLVQAGLVEVGGGEPPEVDHVCAFEDGGVPVRLVAVAGEDGPADAVTAVMEPMPSAR